MKAAFTKTRWFKITSILVVGTFLFQVNAFALSYEDRYAFDDWDDGVTTGLIGLGMTFAAPFLPGGTGIVGGAVRGATIGGINAAITGGNIGEGMATGGAIGGAMGGFGECISGGENIAGSADLSPGAGLDTNAYFDSVGNSMAASSAGGLAAKITINEFGASPEIAQFTGMATSAFTGAALSFEPTKVTETTYDDYVANGGVTNDGQAFGPLSEEGFNAIAADSNTIELFDGGWAEALGIGSINLDPTPVSGQPTFVGVKTEFFNWQDTLKMSATQAGITVGVESALKDEQWGPAVGRLAGEWGTKALNPPEEMNEREKDERDRQFKLDLVQTGAMVGSMEAGLESNEAWRVGNASRMFAGDFLWKAERESHNMLTGNEFVDTLWGPVMYMAVDTGISELQEQTEMDPVMFNYATAAGTSALQAGLLSGSEEAKKDFGEEFNRRMVGTEEKPGAQWNLVNVGSYDPEKFGNNSKNGDAVDELTSSNSQLWGFAGLSGITSAAHQIEEKGGDWRPAITQHLSKDAFTSYYNRAGMVYDSQTVNNAFETTYAVSNAVLNPDPNSTLEHGLDKIGKRVFADGEAGKFYSNERIPIHEDYRDLRERIHNYPGPVTVVSGKIRNDRTDEVVGEELSFHFGDSGKVSYRKGINETDEWEVIQSFPTEDSSIKVQSVKTFNHPPEHLGYDGLYLSHTVLGEVEKIEYKEDNKNKVRYEYIGQNENTGYYWNENTCETDPLSFISPDSQSFLERRMDRPEGITFEFANAQQEVSFKEHFRHLDQRIANRVLSPQAVNIGGNERSVTFDSGNKRTTTFTTIEAGDGWRIEEVSPVPGSDIAVFSIDIYRPTPEGSDHSGLYLSQNESGLVNTAKESVIKKSRTIYEWNDGLQQNGGASLNFNIEPLDISPVASAIDSFSSPNSILQSPGSFNTNSILNTF